MASPSSSIVRPGDTSTLPRQSSHFRPDVQGMRALAVILVVLDHAGVARLAGGYVGVDVFFVISGYVITQSLVDFGPGRLGQHLATFYGRRIRRIVPAATLTLIATMIAALVALRHDYPPLLLSDVRWASLFAENFRLSATSANYFVAGLTPSLVTQFWSLAVEEQFYLLYPLVFLTTLTLATPRVRAHALRAVLALGVIASAWWSWHASAISPISSYYSLATRFWELALGGLVALWPQRWRCRSRALALGVGVLALVSVVAAALHLNTYSVYPGVLAWWPCLGAAALIWSGEAAAKGGPFSWLAWRPVRYVGDLSYWHYLWLIMPAYLWSTPPTWQSRVVEVAGAAACAVLSYHFIENPIRRSRRLTRDLFSTALVGIVCVVTTWDVAYLVARLLPHAH